MVGVENRVSAHVLSRLKGIETISAHCVLNVSVPGAHVLSRLKGIETFIFINFPLAILCAHVLSRLKGIETLREPYLRV